MSYRDELGQAHERIGRLEDELNEERAKNRPAGRGRRAVIAALLAALVAVGALGSAVAVLWRKPTAVLVMPVDELVRNSERFAGKRVRAQGELVPGTTQRRQTQGGPCEMSFVLERNGLRMPVRLTSCTIPDSYRESAVLLVTAEGTFAEDGSLTASAIFVTWPPTPP